MMIIDNKCHQIRNKVDAYKITIIIYMYITKNQPECVWQDFQMKIKIYIQFIMYISM